MLETQVSGVWRKRKIRVKVAMMNEAHDSLFKRISMCLSIFFLARFR